VYLGDEETGTITFWVNTSVLRMSLARLTNIANRFPALEKAHCPERLGRVVGVEEMLTVLFEMVDAHARIIIPFRRRAIYYPLCKTWLAVPLCSRLAELASATAGLSG